MRSDHAMRKKDKKDERSIFVFVLKVDRRKDGNQLQLQSCMHDKLLPLIKKGPMIISNQIAQIDTITH